MKEARAFFVKCAKYLQTSMPVLKNYVIKSLTFLRLPKRYQATLDELHVLMQRLPQVITDMNALESEFLEYQAIPGDEFSAYFDEYDKPVCINHIWHQISKQIDLYFGETCFKHLAEFAKFLLLIPDSNSFCESIFSAIRKISTNGRHNFGKGATSTSVFMKTTSIRNNFFGILMPKINIFRV